MSFSFCLATTRRAVRFFDSAARASGVISFLPLGKDRGSSGGGLGRGLGDLIYGRALNGGGRGSGGDGGSSHLHGCVLGDSGAPVEREGENEAICLCRLGPGWKRDAGGRTRALSRPTHFGPKSEAEMGARGQDRTALSIWVEPLG
jgi:hypothetical protein